MTEEVRLSRIDALIITIGVVMATWAGVAGANAWRILAVTAISYPDPTLLNASELLFAVTFFLAFLFLSLVLMMEAKKQLIEYLGLEKQ